MYLKCFFLLNYRNLSNNQSQPGKKKPFNKEPSRRQVKLAKTVDDTNGFASNDPIKPDDQLKLTEEVTIHNLHIIIYLFFHLVH